MISPEHAAIIQREYATAPRGAATRAAKITGIPFQNICKLASRRGWSVPHYHWSQAEEELLAEICDLPMREIQMRLRKANRWKKERSIIAIEKRLSILGLGRQPPANLTAKALAELLGVHQQTVVRWINRGWLVAHRENNRRVSDDPRLWNIKISDLRKFLLDHVSEWCRTWDRIDPFWLVDILGRS